MDDSPTFGLKDAGTKLRRRGGLPGAFGYDLAADTFRHALAHGVSTRRLLAAAMPTSWMVNNRAPSTVFRKWLLPPHVDRWERVLALLSDGYVAWGELDGERRAALNSDVEALCIDGQGVAAVSKVAALLVPQTVCLMDDSAIAFLTGGVSAPKDDSSPQAGPEHFLPMLDAFCEAVVAHEAALIEIARGYDLAPLDAPQVLDRVLWYDSYGSRHFQASAV